MFRIYTVQEGDTIDSIADKFNTTKDELERINGFMTNYPLFPNTNIIVPNKEQNNFQTYVVKPGDTIYEIAKKYHVNYKDLLSLNGLEENDYIYPNEQILIPSENISFYITRQDDSLRSAADKMNITTDSILEDNEMLRLLPDQILVYRKRENQ